tara:strand:- start:135 stop:239 length:105 start_codon:yes stop_codon:yes gene_type:complete
MDTDATEKALLGVVRFVSGILFFLALGMIIYLII